MRLFRFTRIALLCAATATLWVKPQNVRAQYSTICENYDTDEICCGLNCQSNCAADPAITTPTDVGTSTFQTESLACKSVPNPPPGTGCSTPVYFQTPVDNPNCGTGGGGCAERGESCLSDDDCCDDLSCSDGGQCAAYF